MRGRPSGPGDRTGAPEDVRVGPVPEEASDGLEMSPWGSRSDTGGGGGGLSRCLLLTHWRTGGQLLGLSEPAFSPGEW